MKKCPFCAEEIQDEAKKCKHCGEFIEAPAHGPLPDNLLLTPERDPWVGINKLGYPLTAIAVLVLVVWAFIFTEGRRARLEHIARFKQEIAKPWKEAKDLFREGTLANNFFASQAIKDPKAEEIQRIASYYVKTPIGPETFGICQRIELVVRSADWDKDHRWTEEMLGRPQINKAIFGTPEKIHKDAEEAISEVDKRIESLK